MDSFDNWGHVYGLIFNEFKFDIFIKSLYDSQKKKETFRYDNREDEVLFISNIIKRDEGYSLLIGRTNEEVSKTKIDTKTFESKDIEFKENEHISDYTHIFISTKTLSDTGNSHYLLLEKNQRIQIGSIKKLIGNIIGYKQLDDKQKSKLYVGSIMQGDYINKLIKNEIIGKKIIVNEIKDGDILNLTDSKEDTTETTTTQISEFKKATHFLKALQKLISMKEKEGKEVFLVVDDGKTANKKIPFDTHSTKYVPFFQLPYYLKSKNKTIHDEIVSQFSHIVNTGEYETI
jgi:hypothetical protein